MLSLMKAEAGAGITVRERVTRRKLLQRAVLLLGTGCLCRSAAGTGPKANCCFTPELEPGSLRFEADFLLIELERTPSLQGIPSAAYVVDPERGVQLIVIRLSKRRFAAFSRLCTHASQVISYVEERGLLQCNNYNHSTFDLDGQVYKGPADRPLAKFPTQLAGNVLQIEWRRRE